MQADGRTQLDKLHLPARITKTNREKQQRSENKTNTQQGASHCRVAAWGAGTREGVHPARPVPVVNILCVYALHIRCKLYTAIGDSRKFQLRRFFRRPR